MSQLSSLTLKKIFLSHQFRPLCIYNTLHSLSRPLILRAIEFAVPASSVNGLLARIAAVPPPSSLQKLSLTSLVECVAGGTFSFVSTSTECCCLVKEIIPSLSSKQVPIQLL